MGRDGDAADGQRRCAFLQPRLAARGCVCACGVQRERGTEEERAHIGGFGEEASAAVQCGLTEKQQQTQVPAGGNSRRGVLLKPPPVPKLGVEGDGGTPFPFPASARSEERRVGKECRL